MAHFGSEFLYPDTDLIQIPLINISNTVWCIFIPDILVLVFFMEGDFLQVILLTLINCQS